MFPHWSSPYEWPEAVMIFVTEARRILSYYKNYGDQQRPPRSIWHSQKKCEKWIEDHDPLNKDKQKGELGSISLEDWERE